MGQVSDGRRPLWRDPLLLSELEASAVDSALKGVLKRGTDTLFIGLESQLASMREERLVWQREQPRASFSVAELRALTRELDIRGREALRRDATRRGRMQYVQTSINGITLDSRRILNPVGFSGTTLEISATHIYVAQDIGEVIERIRSGATRVRVRTIVLDRALRKLLLADGLTLPAVIVQDLSTVVLGASRSERHVIGIGEDSIAQHLARNAAHVDAVEIATFLYAHVRDDRSHRELMAVAQPALHRWARATEAILQELLVGATDTSIPLIFPWRIPSAFRHATSPQVRGHMFKNLPNVRWQLLSIPELTAEPQNSRHDAYAALLSTMDTSDPYTMNRT